MVKPSDDLTHPHEGTHRRWRESYYFSFYDFSSGLGVYSTIDHRPAKHEAGSVNVLWGDDRPTFVAWEREHHDPRRAHSIGGLLYRPHEPFGSWWWAFSGKLNDGGSAFECDAMAVASAWESDRPSIELEYDLTFIPDQPVYEYPDSPSWKGHFDGHVEEVGAVSGRLRVGDEELEIEARGSKEHSWGVRDWDRSRAMQRIELLFEDGTQVKVRRTLIEDGESRWICDGAVFGGGHADRVTSYDGPLADADPGTEHAIRVETPSARLTARGEFVRCVPLRFNARGADGRPVAMSNDRTNFRYVTEDGRSGIGSVEERRRVGGASTS